MKWMRNINFLTINWREREKIISRKHAFLSYKRLVINRKIFLMKKMEGWLNEGRELYYTRSTLINKANERRTSAKK